MGRFLNTENGVVVSVDESKDDRFASALWESADESTPAKKTAAKKAASSSKSDEK